jgi:hypothetical protein
MLGWLVNEHAIEPHIPVFDKSARDDGTFFREDFVYEQEHDQYVCPAGKLLRSTGILERTFECATCRRTEKISFAVDPMKPDSVGWLAGERKPPLP